MGEQSTVNSLVSVGVCRRPLSSVTRRICNVTHQGAARGGPVVLRPVRATPCLFKSFRVTCCAECDEGRYGVNCSSVCDCANGSACDPVTGRCRCGLGRTGARCDVPCDRQHYGQNCSRRCECGENAVECDPATGCCRCLPGWYGPRCQHGTTSLTMSRLL